MNSEEPQIKDDLWWKTKKQPILANLNIGMEEREKALSEISKSQDALSRLGELMWNQVGQLRQMKGIYGNDIAYIRQNPITEGSVDIMTNLSTYDVETAKRLASDASAMRNGVESFWVSADASGSLTASMATTTVHLAQTMENSNMVLPLIETINRPTPNQRRMKLSPLLSEIDERLSIKLKGAWQTIQDRSKADRFLQSASSARELISDLLHTLAPTKKVKSMKWFKPETADGNPIQKQRARFVILGTNDSLGDVELQPIYEVGDNIRKLYTKLNSIAHLRDYEADLQELTENLIDQCQIYLLDLIEFRRKHFKP